MTSLPTRFLCATLSMFGTVGLVAFASPSIATGAAVARAPTTVIAASSAPLAHRG